MSDTPHSAMADLSDLPPGERARRYREFAEMHLHLGGEAQAEQARAAHLELASLWTRLATQADRQARDRAPQGGADLSGEAGISA